MRRKSRRLAELQALCDEWVAILGIKEWPTLSVKWTTKSESKSTLGRAYWFIPDEYAEICIARSERDKELTLLHELCHVLLESHRPQPSPFKEDHLYERAINRLSMALLRLKNEGRETE